MSSDPLIHRVTLEDCQEGNITVRTTPYPNLPETILHALAAHEHVDRAEEHVYHAVLSALIDEWPVFSASYSTWAGRPDARKMGKLLQVIKKVMEEEFGETQLDVILRPDDD